MLLELDGMDLTVTGSFNGLAGTFDGNPAGGVHIHAAPAGTNGGIEVVLNPTVNADMDGATFAATDNLYALRSGLIDSMRNRLLYVNVHSTAYPGGEIRGQVRGMAQAVFRAYLSGANEVPSVSSLGGGQLIGEVIDDSLVVTGSFAGLSSDYASDIGSHLHLAMAGMNGNVIFALDPMLDGDNRGGSYTPDRNTFALDMAQKMAVLERMTYVNIHTTAINSGELRGQMLPEANYVFNAYLAGGQEATPVLSRGYGALHGEVRGDVVTVTGSFSGLESDYASNIGSHLHRGYLGSNGPVFLSLTPELSLYNRSATYSADANTATLSQNLKDSLLMRAVYANIHTADNNAGELRGQMLHEANAYFFSPLSGSSEEPMPVNTPANGAVAIELTDSVGILSGSFQELQSDLDVSIAGGVHLHAGLPGQSGEVIYLIDSELGLDNRSATFVADSNVIEFSSMGVDSLRDGLFYVNVHSLDVGSGEIRGTLLPQAQSYLTSTLAGLNEVGPTVTDGEGDVKLALNGSMITLAGSFSGLTGTFDPNVAGGSHLHRGGPGMNGPLFQTLAATIGTDATMGAYLGQQNTFMLSEGQVDSLVNEQVYFNLHTTEVASGEVRGQLLGETNFFPMNMPMITAPASNSVVTLEGPASTAFQATWSESMDSDELVYLWQLSADSELGSFILNVNVGSMAEFNSDFGTVDSILADAGLGIGDSILVYHRAIASDGAIQTMGTIDSVFLKRGNVTTSLHAADRPLGVQVRPSHIADRAVLSIESERPGAANLRVLDLQGRVMQQQSLDLIGGSQSFGLNLSQLSRGIYLIHLQTPGYAPEVIRVVKE